MQQKESRSVRVHATLVVLLSVAIIGGVYVWASGDRSPEADGAAVSAHGATPVVVPTVSYEELRQEYERRKVALQGETDRIRRGQARLAELDYARMPAEVLLRHASRGERSNLATVLRVPTGSSPDDLAWSLRRAGSHSAATLARRGTPVEYEEVVADVARKLGKKGPLPRGSPVDLEHVAIESALSNVLARLTPQQREELLAEIQRAQGPSSTALATSSATLILANMGGFGLYIGASTALGAISGAVGVTLPFVVYTSMSSAIAVAIGPVGWAALAAAAVYKLGEPDYKKTIPGVFAVATSRSRLVAERDVVLAELATKRIELDRQEERLTGIAIFLREMQLSGLTAAPRSAVSW